MSDERGPAVTYAGLVTRTLALALDAAVINAAAFLTVAVVGLAVSVLGIPDATADLLLIVGGVLYLVWAVGYFVTFWSTTGQTPGNRAVQVRVLDARAEQPLRPRQALVRLVGMMLAAIPLLAGFLPILVSPRRRGFHDWLARSVVVHQPDQAWDAVPAARH